MAKVSKIEKNKQRLVLVERYRQQRLTLKAIIKNPDTPREEREEAFRKLRKMPRDASPTRHRRRCALTGRPRGNLRKFGLCRVAFRDLAHLGELPGVTKSSW